MPAIESFHLVLYPLWHDALTKSDYEAIKAAIPTLEIKMDSLMKATLPEWLKNKDSLFFERRLALKKGVDELSNVCTDNKETEIKAKLVLVHEQFRALDGIFE
ncbi:MAG: hypothetical protein NTV06_04225 [candidate division Zixibacteria bacterium]|nr:hypothetical protein [candidate division Zixibacteria bacterium]